MKKTFGLLLSLFSLIFWFLETASGYLISDTIGKKVCQENYLQPVNGFVGDPSCGFNSDMYMSSFLIMLFLFGMLMIFADRKGLQHDINDRVEEEGSAR